MKRVISVKFLPTTNNRPARLKAFDNHGNSIIVSYHNLNSEGEARYLEAAKMLTKKMNWSNKLVGGWQGNVAVFVFID